MPDSSPYVNEDPDELGYWKSPLGRSEAQEDIRAAGEDSRPHSAPAGLLLDILSASVQASIVMAAEAMEQGNSFEAEQHRIAAGYVWRLDPGWG